MASMGSFPFVIDTILDSSLLQIGNSPKGLKLPNFAHRSPRNSFKNVGSICCTRFGHTTSLSRSIKRLRVVNNINGGQLEDGKGEEEEEEESRDFFMTRLEKSLKALANQRDLLQQIVEKRKVLSSTLTCPEEEERTLSSSDQLQKNIWPSEFEESTEEETVLLEQDDEDEEEEEDVKPPPLAGENAMNVILVAAECAPWWKTGLLPFGSLV